MWQIRTVFGGVSGTPYVSTMFFSDALGLSTQDAVDAVGTFWTSMSGPMIGAATWETESDVRVVDPDTGEVTGIVTTTPHSGAGGSGSAEPLPWSSQGLIRWHTGLFVGGKEIRGRTFIPALPEADSVAGVPLAAWRTAADAAAAALIADGDSTFLVYSRKHRQAEGVISGSSWSQWAVLRSRRP